MPDQMCRRSLLLMGGGVMLVGAGARGSARALLDRAIAAAGGRPALQHARVLRWTGTAVVHTPDRSIAIGVETEVEPFRRAVSYSWPIADGRARRRTMTVTPEGGWIERDGKREPMPSAMWLHERQQFAVYGLMRLVDLDATGVRLERQGSMLRAWHPETPPATLFFDDGARLIALDDSVADPDSGAPIPQHFTFEGRMPGRVGWPRRIAITQKGQPYFELTLAIFSAGRA